MLVVVIDAPVGIIKIVCVVMAIVVKTESHPEAMANLLKINMLVMTEMGIEAFHKQMARVNIGPT